jgi:hypothetical protein
MLAANSLSQTATWIQITCVVVIVIAARSERLSKENRRVALLISLAESFGTETRLSARWGLVGLIGDVFFRILTVVLMTLTKAPSIIKEQRNKRQKSSPIETSGSKKRTLYISITVITTVAMVGGLGSLTTDPDSGTGSSAGIFMGIAVFFFLLIWGVAGLAKSLSKPADSLVNAGEKQLRKLKPIASAWLASNKKDAPKLASSQSVPSQPTEKEKRFESSIPHEHSTATTSISNISDPAIIKSISEQIGQTLKLKNPEVFMGEIKFVGVDEFGRVAFELPIWVDKRIEGGIKSRRDSGLSPMFGRATWGSLKLEDSTMHSPVVVVAFGTSENALVFIGVLKNVWSDNDAIRWMQSVLNASSKWSQSSSGLPEIFTFPSVILWDARRETLPRMLGYKFTECITANGAMSRIYWPVSSLEKTGEILIEKRHSEEKPGTLHLTQSLDGFLHPQAIGGGWLTQ